MSSSTVKSRHATKAEPCFIVSPRAVAGARRQLEQMGSNAWAIAPARSASGNALLVSNPHLPWSDVFTWFEAQIVTPETNVYGASLVGSPFVSIAFNDFLGWTQFIVVTHSKKTMTCADTLYGVTMQESGISKRVSVRFEDVTDDGHIIERDPGTDDAVASDEDSSPPDDETQAA